jgi:hypothetical protein
MMFMPTEKSLRVDLLKLLSLNRSNLLALLFDLIILY